MSQAIVFASTCPHCEREQPQDGFTVAEVSRLLHRGYLIEAYCAICDELWPISQQKRDELREVVATTCQGWKPNSLADEATP